MLWNRQTPDAKINKHNENTYMRRNDSTMVVGSNQAFESLEYHTPTQFRKTPTHPHTSIKHLAWLYVGFDWACRHRVRISLGEIQ